MDRAARQWIERRAEPREPVSLRARVLHGQGLAMWADCVIRDLSASGAKIELSHFHKLPPRFVLLHFEDGVAFEVVLKWRRADLAGAAFEGRHDLKGEVPAHMKAAQDQYIALKPALGLR
ncbi:MAG: PilZ domain-containing protein [Phenylobacterium sp.]|uniref:PilZ domain-containing protein n=1 Tax=Phenylobacterium sp. TaxID=1871053 RepID=UPI001A5E3387|nr:PilZ domain-containing protein [Phenylobacterium sp.]MBL8770985.1 PilZ domain-containing protein [Phenylobacterium sp.]